MLGLSNETDIKGVKKRLTNILFTWSKVEGNLEELKTLIINIFSMELIKYGIVCKELHKDGDAHFHAWIKLNNQQIMYSKDFKFNERIPNISTTPAKQGINYCKKEGKWIEWGDNPLKEERLKRKEKLELIKEKNWIDLYDSGEYSISELRNIPLLKAMILENWPHWKKRRVSWYWGPTGSGKTRYAIEEIKEMKYIILSGDLKQFLNGYTGEEAVLFDDLRPGSIKFEMLLRLLDGYRVTVNIKGGQCQWLANRIIITAPIEPSEMYVNRETGQEWDHLDQLLRRIDEIVEFPRDEARIN